MKNSHAFFQNRECEYYPCHKTKNEKFNCLFCFFPLYALGDQCGGNSACTDKGIQDCSGCLIPHSAGGYDYILSRFPQLAEPARKKEG